MELLKSCYRRVKYHFDAGMYGLTHKVPSSGEYATEKLRKSEGIMIEGVIDRLKLNHINIVTLNVALDNAGFPQSIGRIPRLLSTHNHLVDILHQALDEVDIDPNESRLTREERAKKVADYVSDRFNDRLSEDRKIFDQYRLTSSSS